MDAYKEGVVLWDKKFAPPAARKWSQMRNFAFNAVINSHRPKQTARIAEQSYLCLAQNSARTAEHQ